MFDFPWAPEVASEKGIRSTSRSNHQYDFQDLQYDGDETYRVLDIGCGGAAYMEEIAESLYEQGIEDFRIVGVDVNEELLRRTEMSDYELMADGLDKTVEKTLERAEEQDYMGAAYDFARGAYNSIKVPVQREMNMPEEAELVVADGEDLPFQNNSFDLVTSQFLAQYDDLIDPQKIKSEADRVAKTDGEIWFN